MPRPRPSWCSSSCLPHPPAFSGLIQGPGGLLALYSWAPKSPQQSLYSKAKTGSQPGTLGQELWRAAASTRLTVSPPLPRTFVLPHDCQRPPSDHCGNRTKASVNFMAAITIHNLRVFAQAAPPLHCISPASPGERLLFSPSVVSDSLQRHELQHTRIPCPSLFPGVCSSSCSLNQWCYLTISSSTATFSFCLQSSMIPASGSFPMSRIFASGGQSIGASASVSVHRSKYSGLISFRIDWFDFLAVQGTLKHHSLIALILRCSASFLTSTHKYWKKHSFDYMNILWQRVKCPMSNLIWILAPLSTSFLSAVLSAKSDQVPGLHYGREPQCPRVMSWNEAALMKGQVDLHGNPGPLQPLLFEAKHESNGSPPAWFIRYGHF